MGSVLPTVCEDDCLSSMPPSKFMCLNKTSSPNCSFIDPAVTSYLSGNSNPPLPAVESSGIFNGNLFLGNEIQPHDLDFKGDNGSIFCPDPLPRPYNPNELQVGFRIIIMFRYFCFLLILFNLETNSGP